MSDVFAAVIEASKVALLEQTSAFNLLADKIIHAGNATKLISEMRDEAETSNDQILKFREYKDKLLMNLHENEAKIDSYIVESGLVDTTPVDVPATTEKAKAIATQVKNLKAVIAGFPGGIEALTGIPELSKLPGIVRNSSATGEKTYRPRIASLTCNGVSIFETKGDKHIANVTILKLHLAKNEKVTVETSKLQELLFAAAGTHDLTTLNGAPVNFDLVIPATAELSEQKFEIVVIPSVSN